MLPLPLFKSFFITSQPIKDRFNRASIHENTLASLVAADRQRLLEAEKTAEIVALHWVSRLPANAGFGQRAAARSIHVAIDLYRKNRISIHVIGNMHKKSDVLYTSRYRSRRDATPFSA